MYLGKCPYCDDGMVQIREKNVYGKKTNLYACSNARWHSEDGELWELTDRCYVQSFAYGKML